MEVTEITVPQNCKYLSDYLKEIPSGYLINKGITGCGGTTLELKSSRNSIIVSPTIALVQSKQSTGILGVTGESKTSEIKNYVTSTIEYKKIVVTYDSLKRVIPLINPDDYFLLIDEYHLLFNEYAFRNEAVTSVLSLFTLFKNFAFLTATPIKEEFILNELKNIPRINYIWEGSIPVKIDVINTYFVQKELIQFINNNLDKNIHVFLNSIKTINSVAEKIALPYRVVCSKSSKSRVKNFSLITDPIKKVNFYTSCSFEGCDVYDPNGICVIISDTNIATTVLDISTKVRQVCGRLRDSIYKNKCTLILNTSNHRYANTTEDEFIDKVNSAELEGKSLLEAYKLFDPGQYQSQMKMYTEEKYYTLYLNKNSREIYYDENLKKLDIYNYKLISEIYSSSISVLCEIENNNMEVTKKGLSFINITKQEYTYTELKNTFEPILKANGLTWNRKAINTYFPEHTTKRKMVNGKQDTYYIFK